MFRSAIGFICFCLLFSSYVFAAPPKPLHKPEKTISSATISTSPVKSKSIPHPKPKPMGTAETLSAKDSALYKRIFEAQEQGNWDQADMLMQQLGDMRLRGHVLYQRLYHPTKYRSSYQELADWMWLYSDHPGAHEIYKLANARRGGSSIPLQKPVKTKIISGVMRELSPVSPSPRVRTQRNATQSKAVRDLKQQITANLRHDRTTIAYNQLKQENGARQYMDAWEFDEIQAQIASSYLYYGKRRKALELATKSLQRSGEKVPLAGWIAGLTSWINQDYYNAYRYFQIPARSPYASTWTKAAGAYWASRAALKLGTYDQVSQWLNISARYNRTFYGILAIHALGREVTFNWDQPKLTQAHIDLIRSDPAGRRAILLTDAGQPHLASRELLRLHPGKNYKLKEALLAFASAKELPSFEIKFSHAFRLDEERFYDASLYPLVPWQPEGGYKVDKAYIHAIVRQESNFNYKAENDYSKATGLMQLLPSTANGVMRTKAYKGKGRHALKEPQTNITIGQKYIQQLKGHKDIQGNIFLLTIAYNGGPGNLRRWKRNLSFINDPLLFVEMIPVAETRAYVERVLSNYWIYQMRLNQPTPTLDAVVSGKLALLAHQ